MSAWEKTKHGSKSAFDKAWTGFEKLGVPVNRLTNKIGSEAFWPTTLDHESDKAARILKSFCSMFASPHREATDKKQRMASTRRNQLPQVPKGPRISPRF
jgi:hypothetical protein